ncbi:MAG: hypothetical protein QM770_14175 [Tepidisphaeraceae bacterium]
MKKQTKQVIGGATCLVAIGAGIAYWLTPGKPATTKEQVAVTTAARSGDYASVRKAAEAGQFSRDELRKAVRVEFENQTLTRVNAYFTATSRTEKQAILDKAIDDLERFRDESRKRATSATTQPQKASGQPAPPASDPRLEIAAWAMRQPVDVRTKLAEFRVAIEKRRAERGLPGMFDRGATLPLGGK